MVDGERLLDAVLGELALRADRAGVVDEDVEPVGAAPDLLGERADGRLRGEVAHEELDGGGAGSARDVGAGGVAAGLVARDHQDAGAASRQDDAGLEPDAGAGAGDERDVACEGKLGGDPSLLLAGAWI